MRTDIMFGGRDVKHIKRLICIGLILILLTAMSGVALADAGGFAGDSDWGGSDWGGSDWGDSDWDSGSSGVSGFLLGSLFGDSPIAVIVIVIVLIVLFVVRANNKKKHGGANRPAGGQAQGATMQSQLPLSALKEKDPAFSEQAFLEKVGNYYVQLQNAWEAKDLGPIRTIMTDALYNQFGRQLMELVANNQTNHVDRIAVLGAQITGYAQDEVNDILAVQLRTRIVDYVTSDETGEIVRGSNTKELFMTYEWTMIRSKDKTTQEQQQLTEVSCPNCGAPMNVNQSRKCEYCGTVVTLSEYDWVVSAIRGISQQSN